MLINDGAKFVEAGHYFILVTKTPRLFWDNDRLDWTTNPNDATIFALGKGMEEAGKVAGAHTAFEVMVEDVTDKVQRVHGVQRGETVGRRLRH